MAKWMVKSLIVFCVIHWRIILIILAVIGALVYSRFAIFTESTMQQLSSGRSPSVYISAPASTENFLNGMANFNTDLVWNALSPELQERLNTNGNDKETLRKTMAEARQEPTRVVSINYIGGYRLPDQTTYYFYVVGNDKGKQVDYSFYVFTVNAEGTILQVE